MTEEQKEPYKKRDTKEKENMLEETKKLKSEIKKVRKSREGKRRAEEHAKPKSRFIG